MVTRLQNCGYVVRDIPKESPMCVMSNNFVYSWVYFTPWPLRKQAACKQAIRGPTILSPFRGTRQ